MKNYNKILLFLFLIGMIIYPVSANTVDFKNLYQDSNGNWLKEDAINLTLFPRYTVVEDVTTYTLTRFNETVTLPKRTWIRYDFYPDRIVPVVTINSYSQINSLVTKVNASVWYLTFPFSASQVRSVTDDLIDMGVFKRTTSISVQDSNTTPNSYYILPKVIGGDIRLYFNPQTYSGVVYPLILTENTITVTNASTSGFTSANMSLNGSRWTGDGKLAINLNASYLDGLVGYWSMDENTGTTIHNINNESGLINTTNQGTWNGNATLNYTTGVIGNAGSFDGMDDYVSLGTGNFINTTATFSCWVYKSINQASKAIIGKYDTNAKRSFLILTSSGGTAIRTLFSPDGTVIKDSGAIAATIFPVTTWTHFDIVFNGLEYIDVYLNGVLVDHATTSIPSNIFQTNVETRIGNSVSTGGYFDGLLDEVRIYNRALTAPEIAELYNHSMRTQAMPVISNQSASLGNVINRTRITYSGQDAVNNISIYARQNGTTAWDLIQENATSNTWYHITNQYQVMDFGIQMNGNGQNTPFFESIEWDETLAPSAPTTLLRSYQWNISGGGSATQEINNIINNYYNITNTSVSDLKINKTGDIVNNSFTIENTGSMNFSAVDYISSMAAQGGDYSLIDIHPKYILFNIYNNTNFTNRNYWFDDIGLSMNSRNITSVNNISSASITITGLTGAGNDYACIDSTGKIFRSNTAC